MTRAAERLSVSQTALGTQMRQLEEELGVNLLNRHSRGVSPTPAGRVLYTRTKQMLELLSTTMNEVTAFGTGFRETITVGAPPSFVNLAATELLGRAHSALQNVTLKVIEETSAALLDALRRGELDLIFGYNIPENDPHQKIPWLREELIFVTARTSSSTPKATSSHDITQTITLAKALETELTLPVRMDGLRRMIEAASEPMNLKCRVAFEVQSAQALITLLANRPIASILPYGLAFRELQTGLLEARRLIDPAVTRTLYLVRGPKRLSDTNEKSLDEILIALRASLAGFLGPLASPIT